MTMVQQSNFNGWVDVVHQKLHGYIFGLENSMSNPSAELQFFCHGNGVSAATYFPFLERLSATSGNVILCFDTRGFGQSAGTENSLLCEDHKQISQTLLQDAIDMYWVLRGIACKVNPNLKSKKCKFSGHSLGAWVALFAAPQCFQFEVDLLDLPLSSVKNSTKWAFLCFTGQREKHPLSLLTLHRKDEFESERLLNLWIQKGHFFKNWKPEFRESYKQSNILQSANKYFSFLHSKYWEARLYQTQPAHTQLAMLSIPLAVRNKMTVRNFWGSDSVLTNQLQWSFCEVLFGSSMSERIENAGHFFLFERPMETVQALSANLAVKEENNADQGNSPKHKAENTIIEPESQRTLQIQQVGETQAA